MTTAADFTNDPAVRLAVDRVRDHCHGKQYSDVIDAEGNQYVDLVMEGGGVLGIALVGYTYVLEQAGLRFLGLGGTSAGSINALMIAALAPPAAAKSEQLVEVLADIPMNEFIDGDSDARDFSRAVLGKARMSKLLFKGMQVMDNLSDDLGLNPGRRFQEWLQGELARVGMRTLHDLKARLADVPDSLALREGARGAALEEASRCGRLAMVAADVSTETKVEFPKMAELYWENPEEVELACFARASMSIPFFFHPFRIDRCPPGREDCWRKHAGYDGTAPTTALLIDGGIMSNFPINLFHRPLRMPNRPTFGAKIGSDRSASRPIQKPAQLLSAIFDAARHTLDFDFIIQNPDYRHLVAAIQPDARHHWLDFALSLESKVDLFGSGAKAAADFLCGREGRPGFDWAAYQDVRHDLIAAHRGARD